MNLDKLIRTVASARPPLSFALPRPGQAVLNAASEAMCGGLRELARQAGGEPGSNVFEKVLRALEVAVDVPPGGLARIPASGPLVVAANHPTGLLDGAVAAALALRIRPDVRVLVNHLLPSHPGFEPYLIRVDPYARRGSAQRNLPSMRAALEWLRNGHALIVFPAGDVSRLDWKQRAVADPEWGPSTARLIRAARAAALPFHIGAANSAAFHVLGAVHPRLRTLRLPFELLNKRGARVQVRIGMPVPWRKLSPLDDGALIAHLQARNSLLGKCTARPMVENAGGTSGSRLPTRRDLLERSLGRRCLVENAEWAVALFRGEEDPELLHDVGRAREISFRAAGEGAGREIDVDRFDPYYDQLVLWNLKDGAIAGGYRIGPTSSILPAHGIGGLYTSTLFRYQPGFFRRLGPAAELGRSFVSPAHQKQYMALLMLWQAIGAWVCRHPEVRYLFGPVSISQCYQPVSRMLMSIALQATAGDPELARLVRPRRPLNARGSRDILREWQRLRLNEAGQLSELVASIEPDGKGLPVLLRQYLRLGGRLLAFSVDPEFSGVLDGLILVDLLRTEREQLERYLTPEGARAYLQRWKPAA